MTHVIAHRGASGLEPENTVAAFRGAVALGVDGVELDVRRSADGKLVVHHDARLADGRAIVTVPRDGLPPTVPTLDEALDACVGVIVNVEIKNDPTEPDFDPDEQVAERVAAVLAARPEPATAWLVSSFRLATIDRVRAVGPALATAFLTIHSTPDELAAAVAGRHGAVHPWVATLTAGYVAQARRLGLRVNTWTCNDPHRAREVASWGVDGIVTDVPDVMRALLGADSDR